MSCPTVSCPCNQSQKSHQNCLLQGHMSVAVDLLLHTEWKNRSGRIKKVSVLLCTTIIWQFLVALCYSSQSYTLTCKYANMQSFVGFNYITFNYCPWPSQWCFIHCPSVINTVQLVEIYHTSSWGKRRS